MGNLGLGGSETVTIGISSGDNVMLDYIKLGLTDDSVPEPGTWMLAGVGLLVLAAAMRRRR